MVAKVGPRGQITIPKEIRRLLGLGPGDGVTLVRDGEKVVMMNAATHQAWLDRTVAEFRKSLSGGDSPVEEPINERRREAEREAEDDRAASAA
ncbi:MAG: AbrB/MazE/SpoVT family DNA-binding domain-containing protein [Bifidobacteriaceae bacterium]|jgi:AbrB family looped-hinge helix DNA binding protein|nr:AbrB/MazE/SpoVT family DNA-binding domain-containing protein [Bifidobacteriaceae bacterium]